MSQASQGAQSLSPSTGPSALTVSTSQLVGLYDEFAELVALNSFLYDAFLSLSADADSTFSPQTANGLGVTCQWLRQRQLRLKEEFYQLIQLSKAAGSASNRE